MMAQGSTGWQKILLYVLLLAYLIAPIYQIINYFEIQKVINKKEKIDEKLKPSESDNIPHSNNYEEIHGNNFCKEEDCDKNKQKEFEELFENYNCLSDPIFHYNYSNVFMEL